MKLIKINENLENNSYIKLWANIFVEFFWARNSSIIQGINF